MKDYTKKATDVSLSLMAGNTNDGKMPNKSNTGGKSLDKSVLEVSANLSPESGCGKKSGMVDKSLFGKIKPVTK